MQGKNLRIAGFSALFGGALLIAFATSPALAPRPARAAAPTLAPCAAPNGAGWCTKVLRPGVVWLYRTANLPTGVTRVNVVDVAPGAAVIRAVETAYAPAAYETVQHMALRTHALAAINGGFFYYQTSPPFGFQSMLKLAGKLVSPNPTPRPALGIRGSGVAFAFATEPVGPQTPDPLVAYGDAVGAGPFVVVPGPQPSVGVAPTWKSSPGGFDWVCSGHPRSAAWVLSNGHLMLGAFDGNSENDGIWLDTPQSAYCKNSSDTNSPASMSLGEFIMANFKTTVQAMNLDGGGSTTFVVGGALVNNPSGPDGAQRQVIDGIVVLAPPSRAKP